MNTYLIIPHYNSRRSQLCRPGKETKTLQFFRYHNGVPAHKAEPKPSRSRYEPHVGKKQRFKADVKRELAVRIHKLGMSAVEKEMHI
jgi:hypothetical protein